MRFSTPSLFSILRQTLHHSWCFYALIWGIISGIIFSLTFKLQWAYHWLWLIVAATLFLFALHYSTILNLLLAFLAGLLIGNFRVTPELMGQQQLSALSGSTVILRGNISDDPEANAGQTKLRINNLYIYLPRDELVENPVENSLFTSVSGTIYVTMPTPKASLERSDTITLVGQIGAGFSIFSASMYRPTLQAIERSENGDIFARLKHWFAALVHRFISSPAADLGLGYLMGQKSGLSEAFSDALRAVGMTHVVVASGAHLGILTGTARKLFGKISRCAGILSAFLMVAGFVMIVGFTPSMTRAALVTTLSLGVGYVGRKFTPMRLLSLVAALTLLVAPVNFLNLGWQLSFASFFALLLVDPLLRRLLYGGKKPPWLAGMLLTSFATSIICTPILVYNFGTFSFLAFIGNLVILPTLPYAMLLVFLTGASSSLPIVAGFFAQIATYLLDFHIWFVNFLSTWKMFIVELPSGSPMIFLIYLPTLVFLILGHLKVKCTKVPSRQVYLESDS